MEQVEPKHLELPLNSTFHKITIKEDVEITEIGSKDHLQNKLKYDTMMGNHLDFNEFIYWHFHPTHSIFSNNKFVNVWQNNLTQCQGIYKQDSNYELIHSWSRYHSYIHQLANKIVCLHFSVISVTGNRHLS